MNTELSADSIIDALGGTGETAALCEVSLAAVSQWRIDGIPRARLMFLKLARPELFAARDAHAGRQPPSPHNIFDTVPEGAVVSAVPTSED